MLHSMHPARHFCDVSTKRFAPRWRFIEHKVCGWKVSDHHPKCRVDARLSGRKIDLKYSEDARACPSQANSSHLLAPTLASNESFRFSGKLADFRVLDLGRRNHVLRL